MPLCNDVLKILLPCRPALDPPWMLVTKPVAQHRGLAGGVGARGVTGKITPHHQVASEGGLEGGRGVAAQKLAVIPANDFQKLREQLVERKRHDDVLRNYSRETGHVGKILFLCLVPVITPLQQCHAVTVVPSLSITNPRSKSLFTSITHHASRLFSSVIYVCGSRETDRLTDASPESRQALTQDPMSHGRK